MPVRFEDLPAPRARVPRALILIGAIGALAHPGGVARSALVINEILYDPAGLDAGREYVEIANNGPYAATLDGVMLEAGDGSRPNAWKEIWLGRADAAIPPGGIYRVGTAGPGLGEVAEIDLQNGPDGVRLLKQGFELDRLGWGNLAHPEYYEGHPSPAVRSGMALGRRVDASDSDDNASDFEEQIPTPGRPNRPADDWSVEIATAAPLRPRPGDRIVIGLVESNRGSSPGIPPSVLLSDGARVVSCGWGENIPAQSVAEQTVLLDAPADTGWIEITARSVARDEVPENDVDTLRLRIGVGALRVTEVMARPREGEAEWVEIEIAGENGRVIDGAALDVRGKVIRLSRRILTDATRISVVVEDSLSMLRTHPEVTASRLWPYEGRWTRLRDGEKGTGIGDSLRIFNARGDIEEIAFIPLAPGAGISVERIAADLPEGPSAWMPCADPRGSTPGWAGPDSSISGGREDGLTVHPSVVIPGAAGCVLEGGIGGAPGLVTLRLFDLYGREIRCLMREVWACGHIAAIWDGRDESGGDPVPGLYVAVMEIERKGDGIARRRAALAVAPPVAR
jgi:hypothetical protein